MIKSYHALDPQHASFQAIPPIPRVTSEVRGHRVELRPGPPHRAAGAGGAGGGLGAEAAVAGLEQLLKEDLAESSGDLGKSNENHGKTMGK